MRGLACCLLLLVLYLPVCAQIDGRISGTVVDTTGAVVPGASVKLILQGGKQPLLTTQTLADGSYHFIGVRGGYYDIAVEAPSFVKTTVHNVSVDPAREASVPP